MPHWCLLVQLFPATELVGFPNICHLSCLLRYIPCRILFCHGISSVWSSSHARCCLRHSLSSSSFCLNTIKSTPESPVVPFSWRVSLAANSWSYVSWSISTKSNPNHCSVLLGRPDRYSVNWSRRIMVMPYTNRFSKSAASYWEPQSDLVISDSIRWYICAEFFIFYRWPSGSQIARLKQECSLEALRVYMKYLKYLDLPSPALSKCGGKPLHESQTILIKIH